MALSGWQVVRPARPPSAPGWLAALEPLTTGLLAQEGLKLWEADETAALGIRSGGVVYPVFPQPLPRALEAGARAVLDRVASLWCLMGPSDWVGRAEPLMPSSVILHRVEYDFLIRPASGLPVPPGDGELRPCREGDADLLFPLQEGYEKEEVLFQPEEFQPLASRLHFWKSLKNQEILALWEGGRPVAKAGTNALTPRWAQLGGVYTRPDRRGRGLQKRLLAGLLNRLTAQGRGSCLFVKKKNLPAVSLYRSLGFGPGGDFTILYGERRAWAPRFP